ncbi:MAG TPA: twin-arginine translocase TatA/TatE family subunit [Nitrososphaerales archaeon]|nr:twin-arginine translocase TatA/TatE family subunit [Nitrososphaerales archaeon]
MAFTDPVQLIIIGVIIIAIFLWGPQKIPDLAKALGRARKEFDDASKGLSDAAEGTMTPAKPAPQKSGDQVLVETAKALGISTEGKSKDQISQEIIAKQSQS